MDNELKEMLEKIINNQILIYKKISEVKYRQFDVPRIIDSIVNEKTTVEKVLEERFQNEIYTYNDTLNNIENELIEFKEEIEKNKELEK